MCAEATVTNRDWKEIENELNGLVPGLPQGEKTAVAKSRRSPSDPNADEEALLAHIADALVQEKQY